MPSNRHLGLEECIVDKDVYLFKANFAFLQSLKENNDVDPMKMYESFSQGECNIDFVVSVLTHAIALVNNETVTNKQLVIEDLIDRFGLQQCWYLCFNLLSDAMIGSVKKSKLKRDKKILGLVESCNILSTSMKKQPLVWMYQAWISGICLWASFNLLNPPGI